MNREAFHEAVRLLIALDQELLSITANSIRFALASTVIAGVIGIPLGVLLAFREFPGRRAVVSVTHTLMGLPTVVVGLLVFSILSRSGPLGRLGLMYTPMAIIIGQAVLALPIILSLVYSGLTRLEPELAETLASRSCGRGASPLLRRYLPPSAASWARWVPQ